MTSIVAVEVVMRLKCVVLVVWIATSAEVYLSELSGYS